MTTSLTSTSPLPHRMAHALAARNIRGKALAWRIADALSRVPGDEVRVGGARLRVDHQRTLDEQIYRGLFEVGELALLRRLLRRGDNCVDVGANVGLYSLLCSSISVTGTVLAFEPSA